MRLRRGESIVFDFPKLTLVSAIAKSHDFTAYIVYDYIVVFTTLIVENN